MTNAPLRVVFIPTPDLSYESGSSIYLLHLMDELVEHGCLIDVLCQKAPPRRNPDIAYHELDIPLDYQVILDRPVSSNDMMRCVEEYSACLRGLDIDDNTIIHSVYGTMTALAGCFAHWFFDAPQVISTFGRDVTVAANVDVRYRNMLQTTLPQAAHVIASTDALADQIAHDYGVENARMSVIPAGVDRRSFNPHGIHVDLRSRLIGDGDTLVLAVQSSFNADKGLTDLIEGFAKAHEVRPKLRLAIAGHDDAPDQRNFRHLNAAVQQLGVAGAVTFLGHVAHHAIPDHLRAADFLVDPRWSGNFSSSVLEALTMATPTLVSNVPGNTELVTNRSNGLTFDIGDTYEMARKIVHLADDADERERLSAAARAWAHQNAGKYAFESIAGQVLHVYRAVLKERRTTRAHSALESLHEGRQERSA